MSCRVARPMTLKDWLNNKPEWRKAMAAATDPAGAVAARRKIAGIWKKTRPLGDDAEAVHGDREGGEE